MKALLLYISEHSGHHCASLAIERSLRELEPSIEILNINSFNYTNPILEKVINRAYMGVVKRKPEIWDYLYDNPKVLKKTQRLRDMIHKFNEGKLKALLDDFRPDAIICTQAFPCGMIADYKKTYSLDIPLVGVLTDYAPHSYWIYNNVDRYIVPSEATGRKLIENGIEPARVKVFGIPIDPKFHLPVDRKALAGMLGLDIDRPCILIMGGTQGLGPIKEMSKLLDRSYLELQVIIATGTNKRLFRWLKARRFRKKFVILSNADNVNELMEMATIIITKAGGITTAEALAKGLPMLIVNSLPGQEMMNTRFLLSEGVAVRAESPDEVETILSELIYNKNKLKAMSEKAHSLARPDSSAKIASSVLELVNNYNTYR